MKMTRFRSPLACVVGMGLLAGAWMGTGCSAPTRSNNGGSGGSTGGSGGNGGGGDNAGSGGNTSGSGGASGGAGSGGSGGSGGASGGAGAGGSGDSGGASGGAGSGGSSGSGGASGGAGAGGSSGNGGDSGGAGAGGSSGTAGGGGSGGTAGAGGSGTGGAGSGGTTSTDTTCPIVWDWEGSTADSWTTSDTDVPVAVSTTQKLTGTQSLKATLPALTSQAADDAGTAATSSVRTIAITPPPGTSNMWPGATITAHVWVPAGTTNAWMQLFMQSNNWASWNNSPSVIATAGDWTTLTFTVPAATAVFPGGISQFGVQIGVSAGNSFAGGDIFIDSITVCGGTQTCSGTGTGSFDFETAGATDGWAFKGASGVTDTVVTQSTDQHYGTSGTGSLKVVMTAIPVAPSSTALTSRLVELGNPKAYCGQTVTYHVYADNVTGLSVQPYASANGWAWLPGTSVTLTTANTWTDVTFTVPAAINFLGLQAMGLQLSNTSTTDTYSGTVYVDGIAWQ